MDIKTPMAFFVDLCDVGHGHLVSMSGAEDFELILERIEVKVVQSVLELFRQYIPLNHREGRTVRSHFS